MTRATKQPETPTPARRMTLTQVVELLLTRGGTDRSSVSLTLNAKGETQIDVTVRTGDSSAVENVGDAERVACEVYDRLRERYPRGTENGSAGSAAK